MSDLTQEKTSRVQVLKKGLRVNIHNYRRYGGMIRLGDVVHSGNLVCGPSMGKYRVEFVADWGKTSGWYTLDELSLWASPGLSLRDAGYDGTVS